MERESQRELEEKETGRLEAFSDGVFAIAITLLVLELHVPQGDGSLGARLLEQWPSFAAFATSFATIGIMWLNHHRLFMLIRRVDHWLLVLNGFLLFGISVLPFPTELVARNLGGRDQGLAVAIYASTSIYIAFAFNALWRYAASARRKRSLLRLAHDAPEVVAIHQQYRWGPVGYIAAAMISPWNATGAMALMMGLALFFLIPPRTPASRG
ncbi:MAG: TMEM175 family protein [Candidatus Eiseniibacteriota bacterium]